MQVASWVRARELGPGEEPWTGGPGYASGLRPVTPILPVFKMSGVHATFCESPLGLRLRVLSGQRWRGVVGEGEIEATGATAGVWGAKSISLQPSLSGPSPSPLLFHPTNLTRAGAVSATPSFRGRGGGQGPCRLSR